MTDYTIAETSHLAKGIWIPGQLCVALSSYTIGASITTGDTFTFTNLLPTKNGFKPVFARLWGQEFDTNASPTATIIVGDATDTDGYIKSKTAGSANQQLILEGDGDYLGAYTSGAPGASPKITIGGTVATAASSGTFYLQIGYICDGL